MKLLPLSIAAIGVSAVMWSAQGGPQVVILSGDADGNLAPCGCTKPMTGGIRRRIQAANQLSIEGRTTLLDNGNFVAGVSRQDQIKAQTTAEILGAAGWSAINVGPADARLGLGMLLSMNSLARGRFIASGLQPSAESDINRFAISPPFLVIGVASNPDQVGGPLGQLTISNEDTIREGLEQARAANLEPILLFQGGHQEAIQIASRFPEIGLIQYRSVGSPAPQMETVGNTVLVSPGSDGKYILKLLYENDKFSSYSAIALGPQYQDEPNAARVYRGYLQRVSSEQLLEKLPRLRNDAYYGTNACGKCHKPDLKIWQHSLHAKALPTLNKVGHGRDPECLPCHVVGLDSTRGFKSGKLTPDLAAVGCESCHGAGVDHSRAPKVFKMARVTPAICTTCHTPNTSPKFNFTEYWKKIKH